MDRALDVIAFALELCNDVVNRFENGFILLAAKEIGFSFESGRYTMDQLPPLTAGDVEVLAKIKQGAVFGGTVFAIGFDEGKAVAFLTVFTFVGSVSDKHDQGVESVRRMLSEYWGDVSAYTVIARYRLFSSNSGPIGPKRPDIGRNSPFRRGGTRKLETKISVLPDWIAIIRYVAGTGSV